MTVRERQLTIATLRRTIEALIQTHPWPGAQIARLGATESTTRRHRTHADMHDYTDALRDVSDSTDSQRPTTQEPTDE